MSRRTILFCTLALIAAGLFIRLGFWQVARLYERRARNELISEQQRDAPLPFATLPRDTAGAHYRMASLDGVYDYDHELVVTGRTRRGAPGADLLTPVRVAGSDTAVLVNRGWVYSPDAGTVNRARWREGDSAHVVGYVEVYSADAGAVRTADPHVIRRASQREVGEKLPYPVAPFYLVAVGDTARPDHPSRREIPVLDDGPHRGYAFQWFSFAVIALVGAGAVVRRERQGREQASQRA
jgi:surfeit locus 1 family protein